jgi:DNA-binding GntR family transcriptional regulator
MPIPDSVDKFPRRLARDQAYETLQEWIVDGILKPGEKVRDMDLAEAIGISRTPVREALLRLEEKGLVHFSPNRSITVSLIEVGQAYDLYPIMSSLECLGLDLTRRRRGKVDIKAMIDANQRFDRALSKGDAVEASRADHDFHHVLIRDSGNAELVQMLNDLKVKLRRLEVAYFGGNPVADRSASEHKQILEALQAGDYERAARGIETNWDNGFRRFLEHADGTVVG